MLSKEEILKIASLAKIELTDDEVERFAKELSAVIDFIGTIQGGALNEEPAEQGGMLRNVFRLDSPRDLAPLASSEDLLNQAPPRRGGRVVSPQVIKGEELL